MQPCVQYRIRGNSNFRVRVVRCGGRKFTSREPRRGTTALALPPPRHTAFMASSLTTAPTSIHAVACALEHSPQPVSSSASGAFGADELGQDGRPTWLHHLEQHGYAVIRAVASSVQVETARDMYWRFFTEYRAADRARPETWTRLAGSDPSGISFTDHSLMQVLFSVISSHCSSSDA